MRDRDRVDKVEMVVPPGMEDEFYEAAMEAGWSDDPKTGKAILIKDRLHPNYGAEILNPTPLAPPLGQETGNSLEEMIERHEQRKRNLLDAAGLLEETEEESEDFEVDDDLPELRSVYEIFELVEEVPALRPPSESVVAAVERAATEEKPA